MLHMAVAGILGHNYHSSSVRLWPGAPEGRLDFRCLGLAQSEYPSAGLATL